MDWGSFLRKAIGDFRHNKSAAFSHGLQVIAKLFGGAVMVMAFLTVFGIIHPRELVQASVYAIILFFIDYGLIRDLAFSLRFIAPDLFGFISLSSIVSVVTAVGAIDIARRWSLSQ